MTEKMPLEDLVGRYPAFRRLSPGGAAKIPFIQQTEATDCGAACLAMVLGHFGRHTPVSETRLAIGSARDGTNALAVLDAGEKFGLSGRGLRLDPDELKYLPTASILHWDFEHFVVFRKFSRSHVWILDPALGERKITMEEFGRSFTGIALSFEPTPEFRPRAEGGSRVWAYMAGVLRHSGLLTRVVLLSALLQLFALFLPILTGVVVDRIVPRQDIHLLAIVGVAAGLVAVLTFLATLARAHLLLHLRTHVDAQLTLGFLDHLMRLPFRFFQTRETGDLMLRLDSNSRIRDTLTSTALSTLLDGFLVVTYLLLMLLTHLSFGLVALLLAAVRIIVFGASRHRYRQTTADHLKAQAAASSYEIQLLEGIETLKAAGAERRAVERWSHFYVDLLNSSLKQGRLTAVVDSTLSTLGIISPLIILGFGTYLVLAGELTLGRMLALSALATGFLQPFSSLISTALEVHSVRSYIERVDDVLVEEVERSQSETDLRPELSGSLRLDDVSFRYSNMSPWAVRSVSVAIEAGKQVAIVGASGSGKTTLARLMLGLYAPTEGTLRYDSTPISDLDPRWLRSQVGFVPQDPYIFQTSVRENIVLPRPDASLEEVEAAARLANVDEEIGSMPMGYDTVLAAGGGSISGGQRQRIALARALINDPILLVLDEATSNLDALSERRVQESLAQLQCTRVVIAHRLSTILDSDLILVMDEGRIAERGSHAELMERGEVYARLIENQLARPDQG